MPNVFREFVSDRARSTGPDHELPLPGTGFCWASASRPRRLRRVWLDTFDWRLYRAGLTLEQTSAGSGSEITLTGRDGTVLAALRTTPARSGHRAGRLTWPARLETLPAGPLREQLGPVVEVRALLPVVRAVSLLHERPAVNSDDKTVARVAVDRMSVSFPAPATPPDRLTITAVRGYEPQALRLATALAAAPGIAEATQSALEAALTAAGSRPGSYSSKISVELNPRMPAGTALTMVLAALAETMEANIDGTVRDVDIEFLHDLRIAVRRTRSVLKLAGEIMPAGVSAAYRPEFKWLGDLTTPTRDLDVFLAEIPAMEASLTAAAPAELQPFHEHLARKRANAQRHLARGLRSARFSRLATGWRDVLTAPPAARRRPAVARLASSRITLAHERVLRAGAAITATSPPESLHDLRKRCKELRYLLEIFGSLYDPAVHWRAVRELKGLQDCLGEFQDTQVQHEKLKIFAIEMTSAKPAPEPALVAPALLAMGEVGAGLMVRQRRARSEFGDRFRDFASPAGQSRIRALTEAA